MTFTLDGEPQSLPPDWPFVITSSGSDDGLYRIFIKRDGRLVPLSEAMILRELLTTRSKSVGGKVTIFPGK